MAAVALLRAVPVAGILLRETEAESFVREHVSSWAVKTVGGGDVSVAERAGVVKPASRLVEIVVSPPHRPFIAPGNGKFRGYEKCGLYTAS